jgi:hypothetical protein
VLYGITAVYFSGVMVRLMLVPGTAKLTPCIYVLLCCPTKSDFVVLAFVTAGSLFLVLYGITAVYFSGVMVRLMLVLGTAKL